MGDEYKTLRFLILQPFYFIFSYIYIYEIIIGSQTLSPIWSSNVTLNFSWQIYIKWRGNWSPNICFILESRIWCKGSGVVGNLSIIQMIFLKWMQMGIVFIIDCFWFFSIVSKDRVWYTPRFSLSSLLFFFDDSIWLVVKLRVWS